MYYIFPESCIVLNDECLKMIIRHFTRFIGQQHFFKRILEQKYSISSVIVANYHLAANKQGVLFLKGPTLRKLPKKYSMIGIT